jgi:membrane-associated phospholipid phosphatase
MKRQTCRWNGVQQAKGKAGMMSHNTKSKKRMEIVGRTQLAPPVATVLLLIFFSYLLNVGASFSPPLVANKPFVGVGGRGGDCLFSQCSRRHVFVGSTSQQRRKRGYNNNNDNNNSLRTNYNPRPWISSTPRLFATTDIHNTPSDEMEALSSSSSSSSWMFRVFCTIGATTSTVVSLTFFAFLAIQRDAFMVSFFIGSILNAISSKVLKRVINQSRPHEEGKKEAEDKDSMSSSSSSSSARSVPILSPPSKPSDNGMPSSHAMSLGFIGTFTALTVPWTLGPLFVYALISLIYRVHTKLHTWEQVVVGAVVGTLNGYAWKTLCEGGEQLTPWNINILTWVTNHVLNEQGILPWYTLTIPAVVGLVVVGSFERRIESFLLGGKETKKSDSKVREE